MDNLRLPLFIALAVVSFLLWQSWDATYNKPQPIAQTRSQPTGQAANDLVAPPSATSTNASDIPSAADIVPLADTPAAPQISAATKTGQRVHVKTDVLNLEIDTQGGDLRFLELNQYAVDANAPEGAKVQLLSDTGNFFFIAQNGLTRKGASPNHQAQYQAIQTQYVLADGEASIEVPLLWEDPATGVTVTKVYRFTRSSYTIDVEHKIDNRGSQPWQANAYSQLQRTPTSTAPDIPFMQTFNGGAIYTQVDGDYRYQKFEFDEFNTVQKQQTAGGWAAMVQHYFMGAVIPPGDQNNQFVAKDLQNGRYLVRFMQTAPTIVEPGASETIISRVFIGPKQQNELSEIAEGLELTVDYGILTVICKPLFWLLNVLYDFFGNWGIAIILITVLVKLAFYKLSEAQYRSMARMRKFTPRIQSLRERYKDDKPKLQQAMMELYKKEKFNPLGGCWPMLVQIPVFIALYWVLLESVELRHAPFMLWVNDLSTKDPYYVMPILLGACMFLQQKMSTASMAMDPTQAKIMQFMPIIFTVFMASFPSGLVLYWFMNTGLGIVQQWLINKRMDAQPAK